MPCRIRSDCGSENVNIAAIQRFFRDNDNDEYAGEKVLLLVDQLPIRFVLIECSCFYINYSWLHQHFVNIQALRKGHIKISNQKKKKSCRPKHKLKKKINESDMSNGIMKVW